MATIRGGGKLETALRELARKVSKASSVRVGFLSGATYPDGTPVALVAAVQDFGSADVPSRPFFRNTVAAKSPEWPDAIAKGLVANGYDSERTLEQVGEGIKGQLQQSIADFDGVPLKPATVKRKGSDKQLVESGHMLNSVGSELVKK